MSYEWNVVDFLPNYYVRLKLKLRLKTKNQEDKRLSVSRETPRYEAIKLFGTR